MMNPMMKQGVCLIFAVSLLQVEVAAQTPSQSKRQAAPATVDATQAVEEYTIGPEDVLQINVWMEPELTSRVTVRPDGKIGVPLLNDVQASGLTPRQLAQKITEGLAKYIAELNVSVIVAEIHSPVVYITGAVNRPGAYILTGPLTVMQVLIRAGGLSEYAKSDEIQIMRADGETIRRLRFDYKQFIEGKDYQRNIRLRRGDLIIVP